MRLPSSGHLLVISRIIVAACSAGSVVGPMTWNSLPESPLPNA